MGPFLQRAEARFLLWAVGVVVAALLLAFLVVGRSFLVPLVLGFLISSIVSAVVDRIRSLHWGGHAVPNWLASLLGVVLLVVALTTLYSVLAAQITVVMLEGPVFIVQAEHAVLQLASWVSDDLVEALHTAFEGFHPASWFRLAAESAGNLLVTVVLVVLYVGFLLAERPWVQGKVARLFPDPERHAMVAANITAIRASVHHYLLLKTVISAITALVVYVIALAFGLKFALLLALLTFFLNFIPNLGSIIATALPVLVALVQFEGASMALLVLASMGVVQFVLGNIVDPMVTGRSLQMSSLAIVIALTFWSAVWGAVGMFLAVPMMAVVMIVCAQVPSLRAVAVLLSKTGTLVDVHAEGAPAAAAGKDGGPDAKARRRV